jgi:predicted ATPase with chaperone activity
LIPIDEVPERWASYLSARSPAWNDADETATVTYSVPLTPECKELPAAPMTLEASGLSLDLVTQLALKTLHFAGELTGLALAERLGLQWPVIEPAVEQLKHHRHCEVAGGSYVGGSAFRYRITDAGRARAGLFLETNRYVGCAPVPLAQYRQYIEQWKRETAPSATPTRLAEAFRDLVLPHQLLDLLGPAINAGHSLFVYGAAGNGKTQIARRIRDVLQGEIAVPHALEIEGQIIRMFDVVAHESVGLPAVSNNLDRGVAADARWVLCKRPVVMAGGEMTLDVLNLGRGMGGYYKAPIQLRANGGVLVIDDFGRQRCSVTELLNRWIVPLESRIDFLTLDTGHMFDVPFELLTVFATNLKPQDLMDEAFLRRIHAKVHVGDPTPAEFAVIFRNCCDQQGVVYDAALVDHLIGGFYRRERHPLRGCHPRDLIEHALMLAAYRDEPRHLTPELLDAACDVYFVRGEPDAGTPHVS